MRNLFRLFTSICIVFYFFLHYIAQIIEKEIIHYVFSVSGILFFFFSCHLAGIRKFKLPLLLITSGFIILLTTRQLTIEHLINGMLQMRHVIAILMISPLIGWVLMEEPYVEELLTKSQKFIATSRKFYFGIAFITQLIAYFLLFGAIPVIYQTLKTYFPDQKGMAWENFFSTALLRGFALSALWVISMPSFAFAVEKLGASLFLSILQGMLLSIVGLLVATLFNSREVKKYRVNLTEQLIKDIDTISQENETENQLVKEFLVLFLVLIGTIFFIYSITGINILLIIPVVMIGWTFHYFAWKKRWRIFHIRLQLYVKEELPFLSHQLSMMIGAGFFVYSLNQTAFSVHVSHFFSTIQQVFPSINHLSLIPLIIIVLGFIGLGPLPAMVIAISILETVPLAYPPEITLLSVSTGSAFMLLLSPIVPTVVTLSSVNGLSGVTNSLKFNWKFALTIYLFTQLYIQFILYLFS